MFWSLAQLLLLSHICLCRDGTIEESIRTKRVISYLKSPHRDFSRYEHKKVVETFHHIVKKVLPPEENLNETADFKSLDTKASKHLSLKSEQSNDFEGTKVRKRRQIALPNSFDFVIENNGGDGKALSEVSRYSIKMVNKDDHLQTTSKAPPRVLEPRDVNTKDITISVLTKVNDSQSKTDDLNSDSSITPSPKNFSVSDLKAVKSYLIGLKKQKEAKKMSTQSPDIPRGKSVLKSGTTTSPKKSSSKPFNNKLPKKFVIHIQSKPSENDVKIDMDMLVSLLFPKGPKPDTTHEVQPQNNNSEEGSSKAIFLWILGVLSLLGLVLLGITVYLTTIRCVPLKGKTESSHKKKPSVTPESSRQPSKSGDSPQWLTDSRTNPPKNLKNLLGKFCEVLGKCQDQSVEVMSQLYGSVDHYDEMKQRVVIKNKSVF